jgi:hypothetical protein
MYTLLKYKQFYILNSFVENLFCQQKGVYNGNNSNPNYINYCKSVNSVLLGQSLKSRARKSNAGIEAAQSFSVCTKDQFSTMSLLKRDGFMLPNSNSFRCCSHTAGNVISMLSISSMHCLLGNILLLISSLMLSISFAPFLQLQQ